MTVNTPLLENLEFIRITGSLRGRANSSMPSTSVKNALRIRSFMQNKAKFRQAKMNVSNILTMNYENKTNWTLGENKPNQTQFRKVSGLDNNLPNCYIGFSEFLYGKMLK